MRIIIIIISITCFWLFGCSSSVNYPNYPSNCGEESLNDLNIQSVPVFVSDYAPDGSSREGMGIMGLYKLVLKPYDAQLIPLRKASLEDVLECVDITNFLTMAPCTNCVKIQSISKDAYGNIVLKIGIKHPFGVGDPLKPITGRNRADLHVFNVEGIVMSNAPTISFSNLKEKIASFKLLNADGYTGYLDSPLDKIFNTEATIHPYVLHFDDYSQGNFDPAYPTGFQSVTTPPPFGNLVMAMGCDYDFQDYVFDLSENEEIELMYAVGCTYAVSSANKQQRFSPEYRIPQHNKKAASEVRVEVTRNGLAAGVITSSADLTIQVLDINHGVPVGSALNEMRADSSVSQIQIDIPNVLVSLHNASVTPVSGYGRDPANPLTFVTTITNEAGANIGSYVGLVKVKDAYSPRLNVSPLLNNKDGIQRVDPMLNPLTGLFDIDEFATYAIFKIDIASSNLPPFVELLSSCDPIYTGGRTVLSVGLGTHDQDGNNLVLYEYDFDYDGVHFNADAYNTNGAPVTTNVLINNTSAPITRKFALRVTDDGVPPASGIGTKSVTLHPVNSNGKNIQLRGGASVQPRDLGVIESTGEIIVGFSDNQVWKYTPNYSSGSFFYTIHDPVYNFNLIRLDVTKNGYSLVRSDNVDCSLTYSPTGSLIWRYINQGIQHTAGVTNLDGNWNIIGIPVDNKLIMLTDWENRDPPLFPNYRWFQITYNLYNGFSGWLVPNGDGVGTFSSFYTVSFDYKRDASQYWVLEGAPRYELELFQSLFTYMGKTIGLDGAQSDGLNGFNDPKDVCTDVNNRVYVLDKLSNGVPCIKLYDAEGNPVAIFGTCGEIGGEPIALDPDEGDGEVHVLHSNGVSIFYPSEIP